MITYSLGANGVASLEARLKDEELSVRVMRSLREF